MRARSRSFVTGTSSPFRCCPMDDESFLEYKQRRVEEIVQLVNLLNKIEEEKK